MGSREQFMNCSYSMEFNDVAKKLKITWVKSTIGCKREHRRTIRALGLKRLHHVVYHDPSPQIKGMVRKVSYLVAVEEVSKS